MRRRNKDKEHIQMSSNPSPFLHANKWSRFFHRWRICWIWFIWSIEFLFSWIVGLFNQSHRQGTLHLIDLYDLPSDYKSKNLTEELENNWFDEIQQYGEQSSLFRATLRTVRWKPLLIGSILIPIVSKGCWKSKFV